MDTYMGNLDVEEASNLKIKRAYYSLDDGNTWIEIERNSTIYIPEGADPDFKVHIRNEGGTSYQRTAWAQPGYECDTPHLTSIGTSTEELSYMDTEDIIVETRIDILPNKSYSLHIKDGIATTTPSCPSDDQFNFYISTLTPPTATVFDYFLACNKPNCRYNTTEKIGIGVNRVKNVGDSTGIYMKIEELNADGTIKDGGFSHTNQLNVSPGHCAAFNYDEETNSSGNSIFGDCRYIGTRMIQLNPRPTGTYYFGMKVWADGESEPSYPVPDSPDQPANAKAWSIVCELPTPTPTPTPTLTPTPTPTPTPTRPPVLGECVFPRILTGTLTPRMDKGVIFYRIRCIIDKWSSAIHI